MSYTLKIRWTRTEGEDTVDETVLFLPADEIRVNGQITDTAQMKAWPEGSYQDYRSQHHLKVADGSVAEEPITMVGRLITTINHLGGGTSREEKTYLATHAWLLGADGGTIERVAP